MTGPLARYAEGFREELSSQGVCAGARGASGSLGGPSSAAGSRREAWIRRRWMALSASSLRRAALVGYAALRSAKALAPLLGYLRGLGLVAVPRPGAAGSW